MPRAQNSPRVEDGFTMIANELLEAILAGGFTQREQSVILSVIRKTYGYGKKTDDMSASQIAALCNVPRQHVATTLVNLAARNVISKTPGKYGSIIGVQKNYRKWIGADFFKSAFASPDSGQGCPALGQGGCPDSGQGDEEREKSSFSAYKDGAPSSEAAPELNFGSPESGQGCPESGHVPIWVDTCPDLGQVASPDLGHTKENLPKENKQKKTSSSSGDDVGLCPVDSLVNLYHELLPKNPKVLQVTEARKKSIRARWTEAASLEASPFGYETKTAGLEAWRSFFGYCAKSDFLTGGVPGRDGKKPFRAGLDFLFSPSGFAKTLEGTYHDGIAPGNPASAAQADGESWRRDPRFAGAK
ncbi:replication protein [Herbaspirillum sp. AP02]|uniref:replication protein n=1 Tax=unclassified Herbaspirillum TaxID=2624150 RepID=UPI0015DB9FEF|nr:MULTISPECIES: replication protein [unclassified Herbaspirillum]MBG7619329.1 replication protein [Herbaspirillum sp. AP02]NZD66613.1 replication protein [Herbaspirillum sp. AP21]